MTKPKRKRPEIRIKVPLTDIINCPFCKKDHEKLRPLGILTLPTEESKRVYIYRFPCNLVLLALTEEEIAQATEIELE